MAEYHVGCGIAGIYAGTIKKNGYEWQNKSDVTDEAIKAVVMYFTEELISRKKHHFENKYICQGRTVKIQFDMEDE